MVGSDLTTGKQYGYVFLFWSRKATSISGSLETTVELRSMLSSLFNYCCGHANSRSSVSTNKLLPLASSIRSSCTSSCFPSNSAASSDKLWQTPHLARNNIVNFMPRSSRMWEMLIFLPRSSTIQERKWTPEARSCWGRWWSYGSLPITTFDSNSTVSLQCWKKNRSTCCSDRPRNDPAHYS